MSVTGPELYRQLGQLGENIAQFMSDTGDDEGKVKEFEMAVLSRELGYLAMFLPQFEESIFPSIATSVSIPGRLDRVTEVIDWGGVISLDPDKGTSIILARHGNEHGLDKQPQWLSLLVGGETVNHTTAGRVHWSEKHFFLKHDCICCIAYTGRESADAVSQALQKDRTHHQNIFEDFFVDEEIRMQAIVSGMDILNRVVDKTQGRRKLLQGRIGSIRGLGERFQQPIPLLQEDEGERFLPEGEGVSN